MKMVDVNVLIYAHRADAPEHDAYAQFLRQLAAGPEPFALSDLVVGGFLRIVTNSKAFREPTPLPVALTFIEELLKSPHARQVRPGEQHWAIFRSLLLRTNARGAFIADVQHAAVAIEHGCEWLTNDADFARIPQLRSRHPLRAE